MPSVDNTQVPQIVIDPAETGRETGMTEANTATTGALDSRSQSYLNLPQEDRRIEYVPNTAPPVQKLLLPRLVLQLRRRVRQSPLRSANPHHPGRNRRLIGQKCRPKPWFPI